MCILAPIAVLLGGLTLISETYYADARIGEDRNAGTSPLQPWKHVPGMAAFAGRASLAPGDTVYFSRDGVWTLAGGQGLYLVGGVRYIGDAWSGNRRPGKERATLQAASDLEAGVVRFRDHPALATVFQGFEVDANGKAATGIDINHRFWQRMDGALKQVKNVQVHAVGGRQTQKEFRYGIIVSNFGGDRGVTENVDIQDATVYDISRDGIALYPGNGVRDRIRRIRVARCEVFDTGRDPDYKEGHGIVVKGWVDDAVIEDSYVHDVASSAVFVSGPEAVWREHGARDLVIRRNVLHGESGNGVVRLYRSGAKRVYLTENVIYSRSGRQGLSLRNNTGALAFFVLRNVVAGAYVDFGGNRSAIERLEFRDNVVVSGLPPLRNAMAVTASSGNVLARIAPAKRALDFEPNLPPR